MVPGDLLGLGGGGLAPASYLVQELDGADDCPSRRGPFAHEADDAAAWCGLPGDRSLDQAIVKPSHRQSRKQRDS